MITSMQVQDRAAAAQDFAEGSGEVDPLDAFMAQNDAAIAGDDEEIDPLDAFMADLAPTVRRDMTYTPVIQPVVLTTTVPVLKLEAGDASDVKPAVAMDLQVSGVLFTSQVICK
jgi:hypothetical protein